MKRLLLSMFLTMMLLAPGIAKADVGISDNDMAAVFNESVTGNELVASALSLQEMEETEGAWVNFAIGGVIGLGGYLYSTPSSQWSIGGAALNTGLGVLGGYGMGVAGLRVLGPYANTGGIGVAIGRPGIMNTSKWYGNANQLGRIDFHKSSHDKFMHIHRGGLLKK